MALHGLLDPETYARDPTLRSLVAVVPFGLPDGPPPAADGRAAGGVPGDRRRRPRAAVGRRRVGLAGPGDAAARARSGSTGACTSSCSGSAARAWRRRGQAAAGERVRWTPRRSGCSGTRVHVNRGWVPYAERGAWLAEADLGVSAHHDHLEARYAHRTRVLDTLWAGLPVVATRGDALADLVERERPRRAPSRRATPTAYADGVRAAARAGRRRRARARSPSAAPALRWSAVAAPLVAWCAERDAPAAPRAPRRRAARGAGAVPLGAARRRSATRARVAAARGASGAALRRAVRLR